MPCYSGEKDKALKIIHDKFPAIASYLGKKSFLMGESPVWVDFLFYEILELCAYITNGEIFDKY